MSTDKIHFGEHWDVHAHNEHSEQLVLTGVWMVEKWNNIDEPIPSRILRSMPGYFGKPEVVITPPNRVVTVGLTKIMDIFSGRFLSSGWPAVDTYFASYAAALGVGDSSTAAAAGQTDLQAATNKVRAAMNSTYPTAASAGATQWQADFTASVGNFAWLEQGLFNAVGAGAGTMFARNVANLGSKSSGVWTLTCTITATSGS